MDRKLNEPVFIGVIFKHGENDFEFWQHDFPQDALDDIEKIFIKHSDTGCSVRGTAKDIGKELKSI